MWLWRGETGLWEHDPATPLNFRGNLLGVAFDPNNPARGYAVGSSAVAGAGGVLLRYGKTWTQESALPPQVQGASFISVAFAGSEAIVAYRQRPSISQNSATGGLLVNDGSGWRVDEQAAAAMGMGVPVAVAGLADGGAAFTTVGGPDGPRVYERESAGSSWQATPMPLPGSHRGLSSRSSAKEGRCARSSPRAESATKANRRRRRPGFRRASSNRFRRWQVGRKAAVCCARPQAAGATRATN